jgi:ADP-ribose pyrophosphatase YjhB (NUDIX family)
MHSLSPPIRNAARALIVRDGNILLLRKEGYVGGERFALPGGGQDLGETLEQALVRECHEEIGTEVEIHGLVHVADCFKPRDTVPPSTRHLVEFLFDCTVPADYIPCSGHNPDKHQVEVVWARLDQLADMLLYPRSIAAYLKDLPGRAGPLYLGNIDWE